MNPNRIVKPPRRWNPCLIPPVVWMLRPFQRLRARRLCGLAGYEIQNAGVVRDLLKQKHGVLITPNHPTHADAYAMAYASAKVRRSFYFLATWNVFDHCGWFGRADFAGQRRF